VLVAPAHLDPERRRRAWLDADPQAPGRAGAFAVEAVALRGPVSLVDDAGRMASELVASAIRHTDAPVQLTVDAGDDMVRIEVRDDDASLPGSGRVVSFELREASTAV
jgi:signal transduction histidine kinase